MTRVSFVVTEAAAIRRLVSAADARVLGCFPSSLADPTIETLLDIASAAIARWIGVHSDTDGQSTLALERCIETWRGCPAVQSPRLTLARWPADVISITEDGVETPRLVTIDDVETANPAFAYDIGPKGLIGKRNGRLPVAWTSTEVAIDYRAGWVVDPDSTPTVPADLRQACALLAQRQLSLVESQYSAVKSESFAGIGSIAWDTPTIEWRGAMPSDVAGLLAPYKRWSV